MQSNLEKLVLRLQRQDMTAFDDFYNATYKSVYYIIYSIIKDPSISEDISQDTYIKVIEKIGLYQPGTNPFAWVIQIAKNLAINEVNRRKKVIDFDPSLNESSLGSYTLNTNTISPILDLAISNLSEEDFQIVSLIAIHNYKRREVSKIMNMPIGTITWRYNEALKKLKVLIEQKGGSTK